MQYRWDDFNLDRKGTLLTREGQQVDVSRKVLDCISHLIEQRHRVVGYDELIKKVWGHGNVSNHRLTQLIVAARRAVGDDGQTQAAIRTMPGLGYRWVGALREITDGDTAPKVQAPDASSPARATTAAPMQESSPHTQADGTTPAPEPQTATIAWYRSGKLRAVAGLTLMLAIVASVGGLVRKAEPTLATAQPAAAIAANPLSRLEAALAKGQYEAVREGLATLPADLADSPDAQLLQFSLDMELGRYDRAAETLALMQARAKAAADPVWQARLLAEQSWLNSGLKKPVEEQLALTESAVEMLESAGDTVSPKVMGRVLSLRGVSLMWAGQYERAQEDLVRAGDLLLQANDPYAARAKSHLARVWMRTGRMVDALDWMTESANAAKQSNDYKIEITSRNTAIRIQIELLRWRDALTNCHRSMQLQLDAAPDAARRRGTLQLCALALTINGRLREAGALLEEVVASGKRTAPATITIMIRLASGQSKQALAEAADLFVRKTDINDKTNLLLDHREGALLLWMIAAQDLVAQGKAMPVPSLDQLKALQQPETSIGHSARGRWLWSQGQSQKAEVELQHALEQAQQTNRPFHMLLASEPLIELLLQRGDTQTATQVYRRLRAHDPDMVDQNCRANLLGLRIALASGDDAAVESAFLATKALAGERVLPPDVSKAYAQRVPSATTTRIADASSAANAR